MTISQLLLTLDLGFFLFTRKAPKPDKTPVTKLLWVRENFFFFLSYHDVVLDACEDT